MIYKQFFPFTILVFCVAGQLYAQTGSEIIDPARRIDWTATGVPGGIQNRTTVCSTVNASTYSNGSADATTGIQNALNNCPSGQVVKLSAGVFRINTSLTVPSNVTLRGAGPDQTTLDLRGSGSAAVRFGSENSPNSNTANSITGGATKGSTSITVSGSGISAGMLLMITQLDQSYMTPSGSEGLCDWCDAGWPGNRDSGQIVEVTGVSGSTVTFRPALYTDYSAYSPIGYRFSVGARNAGLENLKLYANNTGYTANLLMSGSAYCWMKNVESDFADGDHMRIYWSLGNTISDSFFHDGFKHGPGGTDDALVLAHKSSANLIQNNIFWRQHVSVMLEWGAAGNVIAYNYSTGNYHQDWLAWMINDFDFHGAHPMYNLFEGNVGTKFQPDSTWGSSSHSTLLRNWFLGSNQYVPPLNSRGPLQLNNAQWETANTFAITIDYLSQYNNLLGNITGSAHLISTGSASMTISPASGGSNPSCYRIGYNSDTDAAVNPNNAYSTLFFHGNTDCVAGSTQWDPNTSNHVVPSSFYLSSKPFWFGAARWPAIGPDVTGGPGFGGHAYPIPAQACFNNSPRNGNGMLTFNADQCYSSNSGASVAAPTGLSAVAK